MKKLVTEETRESGMESLLGEVITIFSINYIYTGKLIGVNETCCLLEAPSIVYETGDFNSKNWKDAQALPSEIFINYACVEAFGLVK